MAGVWLHVPAKELRFLAAAQKAFATGKGEVQISSVTDFDWDRVCNLIGGKGEVSQADLEQYTKADWSGYYESLPRSIHTAGCFFCPRLGLAFINNNKAVNVLAFNDLTIVLNNPSLILTEKVINPYDPIVIHDRTNADKMCWPKEHAYLVRHLPGPYSEGYSGGDIAIETK